MKKKRWTIIFEDDDLIVIDKPAPFLTIPDRYDKTIPSLLGKLSERRDEVFVNHRLDKETSGLMLFTKNESAHKEMSTAFEKRTIDKHYLALVHNTPTEDVGLIDLPIASASGRKKGMEINATGKESQTKYRILESWQHYSLVEAKLITGRQHQLRVHLKAIGCPILVDKIYGDGKPFYLSSIKRKMNKSDDYEENPLLARVGLHSHFLKFQHPAKDEIMEYSSPLPKDMKAVVHQLSKLS